MLLWGKDFRAVFWVAVVPGLLWDWLGASATFYAGVGFCLLTLGALVLQPVSGSRQRD